MSVCPPLINSGCIYWKQTSTKFLFQPTTTELCEAVCHALQSPSNICFSYKIPQVQCPDQQLSIIFKFTRKANLRSHHKCLLSQKCWSWRLACTSLTNSPGDPAAHEGWRTRKPPKRKEGRTQIGGRCSWRQLADTGSWAQGPGHSSYNQELTRVGEGATPRRKRTESQ